MITILILLSRNIGAVSTVKSIVVLSIKWTKIRRGRESWWCCNYLGNMSFLISCYYSIITTHTVVVFSTDIPLNCRWHWHRHRHRGWCWHLPSPTRWHLRRRVVVSLFSPFFLSYKMNDHFEFFILLFKQIFCLWLTLVWWNSTSLNLNFYIYYNVKLNRSF